MPQSFLIYQQKRIYLSSSARSLKNWSPFTFTAAGGHPPTVNSDIDFQLYNHLVRSFLMLKPPSYIAPNKLMNWILQNHWESLHGIWGPGFDNFIGLPQCVVPWGRFLKSTRKLLGSSLRYSDTQVKKQQRMKLASKVAQQQKGATILLLLSIEFSITILWLSPTYIAYSRSRIKCTFNSFVALLHHYEVHTVMDKS